MCVFQYLLLFTKFESGFPQYFGSKISSCVPRICDLYINIWIKEKSEEETDDRLMIDRQGSASSKYDMQCIEYNEVYMQILKHLQSFGMGVVGVDIHNKYLKDIEDEILRGIEEIDKTNRTSII